MKTTVGTAKVREIRVTMAMLEKAKSRIKRKRTTKVIRTTAAAMEITTETVKMAIKVMVIKVMVTRVMVAMATIRNLMVRMMETLGIRVAVREIIREMVIVIVEMTKAKGMDRYKEIIAVMAGI
jgi:hypothetical protein